MKKSISVLFSILVMLSSCSKDPASGPGSTNTGNTNTDQDNDSGITIDRNEFTAIIDETHETSAKTTLNENQVSWNEGDAISIFDGSGTNFRFVAESSGTSVTFTKVTEGTLTGNTFFAIYPYQDSNSIEGGVISAKTPESYTVDNSAFTSAKSALMIARTTNNELHFKNVSSLLKFEVPEGVDIAKMYFYASGADLSGNVSLSFNEAGQPVINTATPEYKGITIMAEENGTFPAGTYYLPVIPNTVRPRTDPDIPSAVTENLGDFSCFSNHNGLPAVIRPVQETLFSAYPQSVASNFQRRYRQAVIQGNIFFKDAPVITESADRVAVSH